MTYRIDYQGQVWDVEAETMLEAIVEWQRLHCLPDNARDPDYVEKVAEGGEK